MGSPNGGAHDVACGRGAGVDDFRYRCVIMEELAREALASIHVGLTCHDDIVGPYLRDLCTDEQRKRWLPGVAGGEIITAMGMTEPDALIHLMERLPRERLALAYFAQTVAEHALAWTVEYTRTRKAFGAPLASLQNIRSKLAEMATEIDVTRTFVDAAVLALNDGELSATDAAKAKWWASDMQIRVIDTCVQLHGGYGYMMEYPIARVWQDARIQTIYGGANEIMKEIIGRELAAGG
ncbi:acyl-CoA dehydrogenase family protein [Frankia sp. QA3]|uniref:acyl-CoA dehydrogenase family protein n=1 Tax=Frankia sp. QA3 TaxID=710111 RepID=UPI0002FD9D37|nr:acyl-CoA dehydrogenase family protein [Frankia sp. QA3]